MNARHALHQRLLRNESQRRHCLSAHQRILDAAHDRLSVVEKTLAGIKPHETLLDDSVADRYQALILERGRLHQTVHLAGQTLKAAETPLVKATFKDQPGYDLHEGPKGKNRWMREDETMLDVGIENDLEPAPPRRVASPLLDQHEIATPVSDEFREILEQTLAQLPSALTQKIKDSKYRLRFGATLLDIRPDLRGKTPRGWPPGSTFEHVDGLHDPDELQICIFEYFKSDLTATRYTKNTRAAGVFRHEVGHLLDRLFGGLSDQDQFRIAYEHDLDQLLTQEDLFSECAYYVQDGIAGRKEVFAELFAILMGGGAERKSPVKSVFANSFTELRVLLEMLQ